MAEIGQRKGFFSQMLGRAREQVEQNKQIYVERHEYRPATDADFDGRDRAWYDAAERELATLGFTRLTDVVNVTVERAANLRVVLRRLVSSDATTMAALYQFTKPGLDLRLCDLESELSDASFLATSNAEASKAASLPPQIVSEKHPAGTPPAKLVELHTAAQTRALAAKPDLKFVAVRSLQDYEAAQHRQQAIKAAFRAGINYVDPAEVRRIAEQKVEDPALVTLVTAAATVAQRPPSLLENLMDAKDDGAGPNAMAQLFASRLGQDVPAEARDDITKTVSNLFATAGTGDRQEGLKGLLSLMGKLQDLEPKEEKAAKRAKFEETMARAAAKAEQRRAAHRKERLARGLNETTDTGVAEPEIAIYDWPTAPLEYVDQPRSIGGHISVIEAAKAVRDRKTLAAMPIGASRIGGLPDLPPDLAWPTKDGKKLPFIAQLNLADFPQHVGRLLPAAGHLFVFTLISNDKSHWPPPTSVFIHDGDASTLVRADTPADDGIWPDWTDERVYEVLPAAAVPPEADASTEDAPTTVAHLAGEMPGIWGTPGEVADGRMQDGDDWIHLLTVGSCGSMQWSDAGDLCLVIRRSALAKLDFSNVLAGAYSS